RGGLAERPTPFPRSPRPHGRSLLMVAEALIVAFLKNQEIFNQLTWLYATLRLTVSAVPPGAVVQMEGEGAVGVTVPTEMPDPLRTVLIRFCTSVAVDPSMTATRQPSRAAVVTN